MSWYRVACIQPAGRMDIASVLSVVEEKNTDENDEQEIKGSCISPNQRGNLNLETDPKSWFKTQKT